MIYSCKNLAGMFFCIALFSGSVSYAIDSPSQTDKSHKAKTKSKIRMNKPITGEWSGKHITLKITEQGADVEYDCAHGTIIQKIILDKKNRFSVSGIYAEERGGPVRADSPPENIPVKFTGQVNGKKMTLTVKRKDNNKLIGTFTLFYGQQPSLVKCR